jgi:high-affinity nickel permease
MFDVMLGPVFSAFQSAEGVIDTAAPAGVLLLGLLVGLRHAMEADHVAAVSTMVATSKGRLRRAPILGALWGIGHTATLFVAGLLVLLLAVNIPASVSGRLEFGVGVMLLFLAITTLTGFNAGRFFRGLFRKGAHDHVHAHENGMVHSHEHTHEDHRHGHKSIIVGMVHGMAGSGALMLAVLATIESVPLGLAYIAVFGAGSTASMAGISVLIGLPFARTKNHARLAMALRYASAIVAFVIGAGMVYELGFVDRVFQG